MSAPWTSGSSTRPGEQSRNIDGAVIDQIKQRADVVEIVGRHVELKRAGGQLFKGLCPFHTERSPSFTVTPARQTYHCFGCGAHGDAVQFLMEMEGLSFRETVEEMAQQAGIAIPVPDPTVATVRRPPPDVRRSMHQAMEVAANYYAGHLGEAISRLRTAPGSTDFVVQSARYVLETRGIEPATLQRFAIGLAPEGWESLKELAWPAATFAPGAHDASSTLLAVDLIRARESREERGARESVDTDAGEDPRRPAAVATRPQTNGLRLGFRSAGAGLRTPASPAHAPVAAPAAASVQPTTFYDTFRARLVFPVRDTAGKIVAFGGRRLAEESSAAKYLNSADTPIFHKSNVLYGLFEAREAIRRSRRALIVEGYMDVVMLAQYGVEYAVASMGTAATESQLQTLLRFTDNLVFVFDGDPAGQKAARKAAETILPLLRANHEIRILTLPDGLDPDEFVRTQGKDAFDQLVATAAPLSFFLRDQLLQECGGAQSPEQRARYQQRFQALLKLMGADNTLSREYWKMFQQALSTSDVRADQVGRPSRGTFSSPARAPTIGSSEASVIARLREALRLAPDTAVQVRDSIIQLLDLEDAAEQRLRDDLISLDARQPSPSGTPGTPGTPSEPERMFARDALLAHASLIEGHRREQIRGELRALRDRGEISTGDYIRELQGLSP
ncbi:MAG: CHC2 zinc finger domain-containing protein [Variovorax sp.]